MRRKMKRMLAIAMSVVLAAGNGRMRAETFRRGENG